MAKTRNGIYHDIMDSDISLSIKSPLDEIEIKLFFTSALNKKRYELRSEQGNELKNLINFIKKYDIDIEFNLNLYAIIETYKAVEKRGFRVEIIQFGKTTYLKKQYTLSMEAHQ